MSYKRLTERVEVGGVSGVKFEANGYTCIVYPENEHLHRDVDRLAIRLAELEDEIELSEKAKEQQLRELAPLICAACEMDLGLGHCCEGNDPVKCGISREVAENILNAGYRKHKEANT